MARYTADGDPDASFKFQPNPAAKANGAESDPRSRIRSVAMNVGNSDNILSIVASSPR